jgi:hypothetical protein
MESVDKHLFKHGLDTIAYVPDPSNKTKILSAVTQYPLLNPKKADHVLVGRFSLYDGFAKCDDAEAVEFLLSSVDKSLKTHLEATCKGKPFAQYFTNLVAKCRQGTSEHVKRIKEKLKAIQPAQYPSEDIDLMRIDVSVLVDELIACNAYDHEITKDLAMALTSAGGTGTKAGDFQYALRGFKAKLKEGIDLVSFQSNTEQITALTAAGLMPSDLFTLARQEYEELLNGGNWPPAVNVAKIPGALPRAIANVVPAGAPAGTTKLQAIANALV